MTSPETSPSFGLFGLGTMGSALALNIVDNGFELHVANRSAARVDDFITEAGALANKLTGHNSLVAMAQAMPNPRVIILMVPAGAAVDASIADLKPHLQPGDVVIDAGNADFNETRRRTAEMEQAGLAFLGMGVSGGEDGARNGPSIMVGGTQSVWQGVRPLVDAIAAKFDGAPCADRLGTDGAGHFVKTVHNGIEYADMQVIAETYGLMRRGKSMDPAAIGQVFDRWNTGPLKSYLVEITGAVLGATDSATNAPLVDVIVDAAGQKGTGRWTVIEALKLGVAASTIEAAVGARVWSADRDGRAVGEALFAPTRGDVDLSEADIEQAMLAARIIGHSQGFDLLTAASAQFDWALDMARISEIWRAGCIIRSALLDDIATAFRAGAPEGKLAFAPAMVDQLNATIPALRRLVGAAITAGHPVPVLSNALQWFDGMTQARGSADVIQGQRDYFGRHGFDRVDGLPGRHGPWAD
ncbi:NADP-dependent phosphogluconate dehydrogenase [Aestuariibius sp. HNIBRBA575]|uniref:NADP-dependent phosphogluconate dehydrogenase n=1 Tax=Aestuariibius sp. HNIBRBA575 TaxID=3233343 RepID=UPI0034A1FF1F